MELTGLRAEIDRIDDELIRLFVRRMDICSQVAQYKQQHGLPILMPVREAEKLRDVAEKAGPEMSEYAQSLYRYLFELSRNYQSKQTGVV